MATAQRTLSPLKSGSAPVGTIGWVGRKGARCAFTPMGPMPAASRGGKQWAAHGQQADLWMAGAAPAQVGLHMQALACHPCQKPSCAKAGAGLQPCPARPHYAPGPPPPWGMQKVLCRFRWHTSAPMMPGAVRPTCGRHRGWAAGQA